MKVLMLYLLQKHRIKLGEVEDLETLAQGAIRTQPNTTAQQTTLV